MLSGNASTLTGRGFIVTERRGRKIVCSRPWSCSRTNVNVVPFSKPTFSFSSKTA